MFGNILIKDTATKWEEIVETGNYAETAAWTAISANIAKVAENVTKTTAEGATFTLFTPVMTTAGAEFVWLNHNRIGLDKLVVATDKDFTTNVTGAKSNSTIIATMIRIIRIPIQFSPIPLL